MSGPTLAVEIAFTTNPGDVPVWENVTAYARSLSIRRGRQRRADHFQAGSATVTLKNTDRRFEPDYASGAYYPNVLPMRRLRISATWDSTTYRLFTGFIARWPPSYPSKNLSWVTVEAVDGFKILNMKKLNSTYSEELTSVRVSNAADDAGWPATDRNIDTGQSSIQAVTLENEAALMVMQDAEDVESGRLFIAGDGDLTFIDRHSLLLSPYNTSQATFGPNAGELPYASIVMDFTDDDIYNEIRYTREGGIEQTAEDATSQASYLTRTLAKTGQLHVSDLELASAAEYHLSQWKDPHLGVEAITIKPYNATAIWPHALGRELADRLTVKHSPPGGGADFEQEVLLEGIRHDVEVGNRWETQWWLSSADTRNYWILGDATYSVLDTTTRLAY